MNRCISKLLGGTLLAPAAMLVFATVAAAQTPPPPPPVVIVGNTQAMLPFDKVTLAPGQQMEQTLDVSDFKSVSFLAKAESGPNLGRVNVNLRYGPPDIPVPDRLDLIFGGGTTAHRSAHMPVMGPQLTLVVINQSSQTAQVSIGIFAVK